MINEGYIIEQYVQNRKYIKEISKEINISTDKIKDILKRNNIEIKRSCYRKYTHTYDFFENINTEKKAYWLGFILADGYINSKGNVVGIELKSDDMSHLEKFKTDICATNPIHIYHKNSTFREQDNCRILVNSFKTKEDLLNLGLTSNKSYDGVLPKVEKSMTRHLVRGYFDGNGSVSVLYKNKNGTPSVSVCICGTKEILKCIEEIVDGNVSWSQRYKKDNNNYQIQISTKKWIYYFLNYMYDDCDTYLDRKYEKYKLI